MSAGSGLWIDAGRGFRASGVCAGVIGLPLIRALYALSLSGLLGDLACLVPALGAPFFSALFRHVRLLSPPLPYCLSSHALEIGISCVLDIAGTQRGTLTAGRIRCLGYWGFWNWDVLEIGHFGNRGILEIGILESSLET
jgi:hypothetical protein